MSERWILLDCACGSKSSSWRSGDPIPDPYEDDGVIHTFAAGYDCKASDADPMSPPVGEMK